MPLKREVRIQRLRRVSCTSLLDTHRRTQPRSHAALRRLQRAWALSGYRPRRRMSAERDGMFLLCKEGTEEIPKEKGMVTGPCLFVFFCRGGGSGTPEFQVENRKNRWKNSLSRRFFRFFRFDFFFGGLGGVQPQSRAPRLGSSGAFFSRFLRGQKAAPRGSASLPGGPNVKFI